MPEIIGDMHVSIEPKNQDYRFLDHWGLKTNEV